MINDHRFGRRHRSGRPRAGTDLDRQIMIRILILTLVFTLGTFAQTETVTNASIIEMTQAGLPSDIILKKIGSSKRAFDISTQGLVALKKAGVDDSVIAYIMEEPSKNSPPAFSDSNPTAAPAHIAEQPISSKVDALASAKSIAFTKSSLHPSRQALEKELMKRKDFQQMNLSILRYKEQADLFVEIGYVSGSWITHRYVYRIYDRHSGAVLAAGETTSWGSLAENLARNIAKSLTSVRVGG